MTQLAKDNATLSGRELSDYCTLVGNPCDTEPREAYRCGQSNRAPQKYKFSGEANPEFADPAAFKAWGNVLLSKSELSPALIANCLLGNLLVKRTGGYNVLWHNCQTFARDMANVGSV
jgi:hypothetical protein